jgi:flagellar hook protein FlgE
MRAPMRIAAGGLQAAQLSLDMRAHAIANVSSEGSTVDLPAEVVGLITAELMYGANARMLRTQAETSRTLLDVLA